jgi:hypothetical protein
MGWLDNSTNNIILDAVLTDYGRQALARNDGSFRISRFSLGDDEVDYSIITKYGRTVGREKIEKNTPVFEAFTNQNLGLKYRMVSVPRPLLYLPEVSLSGAQAVSLTTTSSQGGSTSNVQKVIITQVPRGGESSIDPDLLETNFDVYVPDLFLSLDGITPVGSPDVNKIAMYTISTVRGQGNPTLTLDLRVKPITKATFDVYGRASTSGGDRTIINTSVKVVGKSSGAVKEIPVTITK